MPRSKAASAAQSKSKPLTTETTPKSPTARIKRSHVTSMNLNREIVTDEVMETLIRFKNLRELHILGATASDVTDTGRSHISALRKLEWVNLDTVAPGDKWLSSLKDTKHLCGLQLTASTVTSEGLQHIVKLKKLKYLDLERSTVNDECVRIISQMKKIRTLRLCSTRITDRGLQLLKSLNELQSLYINNTFISELAVKQLQKTLPNCQISWSPSVVPEVFREWMALSDMPAYQVSRISQEGSPLFLNPRWPRFGEPRFISQLPLLPEAERLKKAGLDFPNSAPKMPRRIERSCRAPRISLASFKFIQPEWIDLLDL